MHPTVGDVDGKLGGWDRDRLGMLPESNAEGESQLQQEDRVGEGRDPPNVRCAVGDGEVGGLTGLTDES